jgi:hypothetical protein
MPGIRANPSQAGQQAGLALCRKCRKCSIFQNLLDFLSRAAFPGRTTTTQGKKKRTKTAGIVRNLVRKNANLLKISVSCGA